MNSGIMIKSCSMLTNVFLLLLLFSYACQEEEPKDEQLARQIASQVWTQNSASPDCSSTTIKRLQFKPDGTYFMEFEPKTFPGDNTFNNTILERWGVERNQSPVDHSSLFKKDGTYQVRNGVIELKDEFIIKFGKIVNGTLTTRDSLMVEQVSWQITQADKLALKVTSQKGPLPGSPIACDALSFVPAE